MRLHQLSGNETSANFWMSKLLNGKTGSKVNDISQLLKAAAKGVKMKEFLDALDSLLSFRSLWMDFQVGCLHRLLTLRCPEVCSIRVTFVTS